MCQANTYDYDLFISYARADLAWVHGYLLPSLGLPLERVITEQRFAQGASLVAEFEQAIQKSRLTVLVYSPAFPANEWTDFSERLASHLAVETQRERVVMLQLQPCELPLRLEPRMKLDCTDSANWRQAVAELRDFLELPEPKPEDIPCPYPGMAPFRYEDAQRFFGREDEIQELRQRLDEQSLILVMGPSGSGKSSLLAAGLIPALPEGWIYLMLRPGSKPFDTLRSTFAGIAGAEAYLARWVEPPTLPGEHFLLIVDQLEELFVQAEEMAAADQITPFMDAIVRLQRCPGWTVILTLRADFFSDLMNSRLWPITPEQRLELTPLRGEGLRPVIQRPANNLKVHLEAGLVETLIADAADEPGVLPLLQQTMVSLWEKRQRRLLPLSSYRAMGDGQRSGLATAVAAKADETMAQLAVEDQLVAQRVFLRLVAFGEGRADTRRQQPVSAIIDAADDHDQAMRVIHHLTRHRLLTLGEKDGEHQTVDIAHDVLITGWPAFREWLRKWRAAEPTRRRLQTKAEEWAAWVASGLPNTGLLDAAELAEAEQWLISDDASQLGYSPKLRAFVDKSQAVLKRNLRIRVGVIGVLVALVVAVLSAITIGQSQLATQRSQAAATAESLAQAEAYARKTAEAEVVVRTTAEANAVSEALARATAQANAEQERKTAVARQLAAQAQAIDITSGRLDTAVLLAVESLRRDTNPDASLFLQQTLDRLLLPLFRRTFTGDIIDAVFSESGDSFAVITADQQIHVVQVPRGEQVAALRTEQPIERAVFCRDTAQLLVVETGVIELWLPTNIQPTQRIPIPVDDSTVHFDPGCRWLVVNSSANSQQQLEFWDLQQGRPINTIPNESSIGEFYFSPSGEWLLTISGDTVELWHPEKAEMVSSLKLKDPIRDLKFSNGGTMAAIDHNCDSLDTREVCQGISIIDLDRQEVITQVGIPRESYLAIVFSGDDSQMFGVVGNVTRFNNRDLELFGSSLGTVRGGVPENVINVWRTDTWGLEATWGIPTDEMVLHSERPLALSFSQRIVTVWDVETGDVVSQFDVGRDVEEAGWVESDVPRWMTTIPVWRTCTKERCVDALEMWDVRTGAPIAQLPPPDSGNASFRVDPSNRYALAWNLGSTRLVAWQLIPQKHVALDAQTDFPDMFGLVLKMGFSADSSWLAASHGDGSVNVWHLAPDTGTNGTSWLPTMEMDGDRRNFVLSPDSQLVATYSSSETRIEIRVLDTGEIKSTVPLNGEPIGFTEDSTRLIVSAPKDGRDTVVVWNIGQSSESVRFNAPPLESHYHLNRAGTRLAIQELNTGETVHVYDLEIGKELMQVPALHWAMDSSGTLVAAAGSEGRKSIELWSVDYNTILAKTDFDDVDFIKMMAFGENSELLVAGNTFSVRRLPDLAEISSWTLGEVTFPDISPDGKWVLASQGLANTYIMDSHTGERTAKLWVPGVAAYKIAFAQDDERLVVAGVNGEKRVLLWKPESLIAEACNRLTRNLTEWEWAMYLPNEPYRKTCPGLP